MNHWSVDIKELKKDKRAFAIWKLEQRINFGIGPEKISRRELKTYWKEIDIDPKKRAFLSLLIQ